MEKRKLGIVPITQELELKDFTWKIKDITIDVDNVSVSVDVVMWENHAKHERTFKFNPNVGSPAYNKLVDIINVTQNKIETFGQFKDSI